MNHSRRPELLRPPRSQLALLDQLSLHLPEHRSYVSVYTIIVLIRTACKEQNTHNFDQRLQPLSLAATGAWILDPGSWILGSPPSLSQKNNQMKWYTSDIMYHNIMHTKKMSTCGSTTLVTTSNFRRLCVPMLRSVANSSIQHVSPPNLWDLGRALCAVSPSKNTTPR